jgi:hypothetical protein
VGGDVSAPASRTPEASRNGAVMATGVLAAPPKQQLFLPENCKSGPSRLNNLYTLLAMLPTTWSNGALPPSRTFGSLQECPEKPIRSHNSVSHPVGFSTPEAEPCWRQGYVRRSSLVSMPSNVRL